MLQTKIWTRWTMWELICLDEGGPQLADLEVRIITPWGRNSSGLVQGEPHKGKRWTRMPLFPDSGSNVNQMTGSRARWPQDRIPDILPSVSDVLVSLRRTDVLFTTCVAEGEGGCQRPNGGDLLISLFFPTSRLAVVWTLVNHPVWVPVKLIHLKAARSLFRLWCWTRKK